MTCANDVLPIILYVLGAILLVALIILVLRLLKTLEKVDNLIEDVNYKASKLNGVFDIIDSTSGVVASLNDKIVGFIGDKLAGVFRKKRKRKDDEYYE